MAYQAGPYNAYGQPMYRLPVIPPQQPSPTSQRWPSQQQPFPVNQNPNPNNNHRWYNNVPQEANYPPYSNDRHQQQYQQYQQQQQQQQQPPPSQPPQEPQPVFPDIPWLQQPVRTTKTAAPKTTTPSQSVEDYYYSDNTAITEPVPDDTIIYYPSRGNIIPAKTELPSSATPSTPIGELVACIKSCYKLLTQLVNPDSIEILLTR